MLMGMTTWALCAGSIVGVGLGNGEGSAAAPEVEAVQETVNLVRYDLRSVLPQFDAGSSWRQSLVSDAADLDGKFPAVELDELYEVAPSEVVLDVITQVLGDELHYEGREISLEGEHGLLVLAPPAVQEQVSVVLTGLELALASPTEVRMDLYTLDGEPGDPGLSGIEGGVIGAQQADRLAERLKGQGAKHVRQTMELAPGRTALLDQRTRYSFTGEYDVEVAQGVFIFDPQTRIVHTGLRVLARGVPTPAGTVVSLLMSHHRSPEGVQEETVHLRGAVSREDSGGLQFVEGPSSLQTLDVTTHAYACTTLVPNVGAVVLTSESNLNGRRSLQVLVLRRSKPGGEALRRAAIAGTSKTLLVVNSEALQYPSFDLEGGTLWPSHPFQFARLEGEPSAFLFDWLPYRFSFARQLGPFAVIVTDPSWDDRGREELEQLMASASVEPRTVNVSAQMSATQGGPTLARWSAPVLPGSECGLVLGAGSSMVMDYDAEVAQFALVLDPVVAPTFEGLSLSFDLARRGEKMFVSAAGTAQRTQSRGRLEFEDSLGGTVERIVEDRLQFDEHRHLGPGESLRVGSGGTGAAAAPGLRFEIGVRD